MRYHKLHSIRTKSVLILSIFVFTLMSLLFVFTFFVIRDSINQLEMEHALEQEKRIENAMDFSLDSMERNAKDWAIWTDTYLYIQDLMPEYEDSNISYDSFANLYFNLVMFIGLDHTIKYHMQLDYENEMILDNDPYYVELINRLGLHNNIDPSKIIKDIIHTIDGPMLFVSHPILPTSGVGEVKGNLIFGRLLNEETVNYISNIVEIEFQIIPANTNYQPNKLHIQSDNGTSYTMHQLISDYFGDTSYMIEMIVPKTVSVIVDNTTGLIIGVVITISMIGSTIIILFIDHSVLKRLLKLSTDLQAIGLSSNFLERLNISSIDDEINQVSKEINSLLDNLNRQEKEINALAYHDYLTGLPNRLQFNDIMNQAISEAKLSKEPFAIFFLDLDSFKSVNDTMGHKIGDDLLIHVSTRIEKVLTKKCRLARAGGDEFLILSTNTDEAEAALLAETILDLFKEGFVVQKQVIYTTTSIGIAIYPQDGIDSVSLIKNADIAMYYSKDQGKNKYQLCDSEIKNKVKKESQIRSSLFDALKNNEFFLHYQPQIDSLDKKIIGFEALLRWNNPKLGFISPNDFIPIAEKLGMMDDIGLFVLRSVCRQNQKWLAKFGKQFPISINLSVNQFLSGKLNDQIITVLNETKMNPAMLELEITESVIMKDTERIITTLNAIKRLGVVISIDDFGTGFSSMNYLKELPVDIIKIAMPFVHDYKNPKSATIIQTIINLAKSLKIEVIAEGVESYEQAIFLQRSGCTFMQGYYFYKPMPANLIEETVLDKLK